MATMRQDDRAGWYDRNAELPKDPDLKIKITAQAKGKLADGYSKLETPKLKIQGHEQTKSERNSVGSPWKPKGRK